MAFGAGIGVPLVQRVCVFFGTVIGASVLVQSLLAAVPGDAIDTLPNADVVRPWLEAEWGLDGPNWQRPFLAVGRLLSFDFGSSLTARPGASVLDLIQTYAAASSGRLAAALVLGVALGGVAAALRQSFPASRWVVGGLSAIPTAFWALMSIALINAATFALMEQGWINRPDWFALPQEASWQRTALALSVLAIGSAQLSGLADGLHRAFDTVSKASFVEAERARGGPTGTLFARHLLVPVLRLAGNSMPALLSGLIVVERGFGLGGCGALMWDAARARDWPLAAGLASAGALVVAGTRLLVDTIAILWDPRERSAA